MIAFRTATRCPRRDSEEEQADRRIQQASARQRNRAGGVARSETETEATTMPPINCVQGAGTFRFENLNEALSRVA